MHLGLPTNMNSITTTLPLKLDRNICSPDGLVMMNSGDLRGGPACANSTEAAMVIHAKKQAIFRALMAHPLAAAVNSGCFHLSTMAATSFCAAAAASCGVTSFCTTLANILGITKLLNTSIHAGLASHGAPRLGVQCNASRSA